MANKLLILGAAMAHKNKSYNLSNAISKGVDAGLKVVNTALLQEKGRLDKIKATNDLVTGKVNDYLAKLDPENLNLNLVPDPIRKAYYGALNGAKSELGKLLIENSGSNASLYAPGTDGYIEMQDKINVQRKKIDKLYNNATKFQQINANWFNEHGNISDAWKAMNPELYAAMSKILNTENPEYTIELDDAGDWTISADIDVIDDPLSQLGPDDDPTTAPAPTSRTKNVKVKLDDLDWEQTAMPEIKYINDLMQAGIDAGRQGLTLTNPQINEMIAGFDARIGDSEGALYSLMFDELPIGNMGGKMSIFTDEQFAEDYPNFDADDPSTYPDFEEMKKKTIDRLVGMIQEENKNAGGGVAAGYFDDVNQSATERRRRANFVPNFGRLSKMIIDSKDDSVENIVAKIANQSYLAGSISKIEKGTTILPDQASIGLAVTKAFDVRKLVQDFKKSGDPTLLLERLLLELGPSRADRASVYVDMEKYRLEIEKEQVEEAKPSL